MSREIRTWRPLNAGLARKAIVSVHRPLRIMGLVFGAGQGQRCDYSFAPVRSRIVDCAFAVCVHNVNIGMVSEEQPDCG